MTLNNKMKKTIFIFLVVSLTGCSYLNKEMGLKDDNCLEELGEAVLKAETGIDIDLTPSTPEK
jgi:hypothetical protein